jgi:hypothetical protein
MAAPTPTLLRLPLLRQCLERQLEELEALECIYPPSLDTDTDTDNTDAAAAAAVVRIAQGPRDLVRRALEEKGDQEDGLLLQLLLAEAEAEPQEAPGKRGLEEATGSSSEESLAPRLALTVGRSPCLEIRLPLLYPERGHPPQLRWAEGANRGKEELEAALLALSEASEAHEEHGGEHLLEVIQAFLELEAERTEAAAALAAQWEQQARETAAAAAACNAAAGPTAVLRVLIFFHHIINATKRDVVQREAVAHGLGGYSKIGWPGVVVVEGEEGAVRSYVRLLQTLRWQQMTVRGEERVVLGEGQSVDDARRLHRGFQELGQRNGLGELLGALRAAGMGDLGATLMK